jgi:hypothetical protein
VAGADLAIESDPARLLAAPRKHPVTNYAPAALYVIGAATLALAVIDRRRRQVDPEVTRRRRVLKEQKSRIRVAADLPAGRAADEVAAALRRLLPVAPAALKQQAESLIGQLEARIYAPDRTDDQKLPAELLNEAQRVSDEISRNAS